MSLGASAAGVKIKVVVEMDKYAVETYKAHECFLTTLCFKGNTHVKSDHFN